MTAREWESVLVIFKAPVPAVPEAQHTPVFAVDLFHEPISSISFPKLAQVDFL